jgi:hypothetical protein
MYPETIALWNNVVNSLPAILAAVLAIVLAWGNRKKIGEAQSAAAVAAALVVTTAAEVKAKLDSGVAPNEITVPTTGNQLPQTALLATTARRLAEATGSAHDLLAAQILERAHKDACK